MEHASSTSSFLHLPGFLFDILLGRGSLTWTACLNKSISRLWSSLQYRAQLDDDDDLQSLCTRTSLTRQSDQERFLSREDADMVMGRLGFSCTTTSPEAREVSLICPGDVSRLFEENEPSLKELREAFGVFDVNQDGFIDAEELQRVLRGLGFGEGKEVEDCEMMIGAFDVNGDRRIDFREFVKLMENSFC